MKKEINVDLIHENLFNEKPLLAYSDKVDYSSWKEEMRKKYIELLGLDLIARSL